MRRKQEVPARPERPYSMREEIEKKENTVERKKGQLKN